MDSSTQGTCQWANQEGTGALPVPGQSHQRDWLSPVVTYFVICRCYNWYKCMTCTCKATLDSNRLRGIRSLSQRIVTRDMSKWWETSSMLTCCYHHYHCTNILFQKNPIWANDEETSSMLTHINSHSLRTPVKTLENILAASGLIRKWISRGRWCFFVSKVILKVDKSDQIFNFRKVTHPTWSKP